MNHINVNNYIYYRQDDPCRDLESDRQFRKARAVPFRASYSKQAQNIAKYSQL